MIELPRSINYEKNTRNGLTGTSCIVCGKDVKTNRFKSIRTWLGAYVIKNEEAQKLDDPAADSGVWNIGADCLRKHPELKEYTI